MKEDSCALTHGVKRLFSATCINMFPSVSPLMPQTASFTTFHLLSASDGDGWFQQQHLTLTALDALSFVLLLSYIYILLVSKMLTAWYIQNKTVGELNFEDYSKPNGKWTLHSQSKDGYAANSNQ